MATIVDETFESGLSGYSISGTPPTTGAAAAHSGSAGLIVTGAGPSLIVKNLPAVTRTHTFRFYFRFAQDTSGSASIYQVDCAAGTFVVQARPGLKLRLYLGGTTSADSTAMTLNQWYLIDGRFVSSGATATADLRIDTIPLTQVTRLQNAADMTSVRVGNTATNTYITHTDDWKVTDQSADYPLGAPSGSVTNALAIAATATGAVSVGRASVKATAQRPTGTGQTWSGITGELVAAAQHVIGQAFAVSNDVATIVTPDATQATGTGTGYSAGKSSKPSIGQATATGAAYAAVITPKAAAEYASGTGTSLDATTTKVLNTAASASSGTGTANNATVSAVTTVYEPGLTLQMGM